MENITSHLLDEYRINTTQATAQAISRIKRQSSYTMNEKNRYINIILETSKNCQEKILNCRTIQNNLYDRYIVFRDKYVYAKKTILGLKNSDEISNTINVKRNGIIMTQNRAFDEASDFYKDLVYQSSKVLGELNEKIKAGILRFLVINNQEYYTNIKIEINNLLTLSPPMIMPEQQILNTSFITLPLGDIYFYDGCIFNKNNNGNNSSNNNSNGQNNFSNNNDSQNNNNPTNIDTDGDDIMLVQNDKFDYGNLIHSNKEFIPSSPFKDFLQDEPMTINTEIYFTNREESLKLALDAINDLYTFTPNVLNIDTMGSEYNKLIADLEKFNKTLENITTSDIDIAIDNAKSLEANAVQNKEYITNLKDKITQESESYNIIISNLKSYIDSLKTSQGPGEYNNDDYNDLKAKKEEIEKIAKNSLEHAQTQYQLLLDRIARLTEIIHNQRTQANELVNENISQAKELSTIKMTYNITANHSVALIKNLLTSVGSDKDELNRIISTLYDKFNQFKDVTTDMLKELPTNVTNQYNETVQKILNEAKKATSDFNNLSDIDTEKVKSDMVKSIEEIEKLTKDLDNGVHNMDVDPQTKTPSKQSTTVKHGGKKRSRREDDDNNTINTLRKRKRQEIDFKNIPMNENVNKNTAGGTNKISYDTYDNLVSDIELDYTSITESDNKIMIPKHQSYYLPEKLPTDEFVVVEIDEYDDSIFQTGQFTKNVSKLITYIAKNNGTTIEEEKVILYNSCSGKIKSNCHLPDINFPENYTNLFLSKLTLPAIYQNKKSKWAMFIDLSLLLDCIVTEKIHDNLFDAYLEFAEKKTYEHNETYNLNKTLLNDDKYILEFQHFNSDYTLMLYSAIRGNGDPGIMDIVKKLYVNLCETMGNDIINKNRAPKTTQNNILEYLILSHIVNGMAIIGCNLYSRTKLILYNDSISTIKVISKSYGLLLFPIFMSKLVKCKRLLTPRDIEYALTTRSKMLVEYVKRNVHFDSKKINFVQEWEKKNGLIYTMEELLLSYLHTDTNVVQQADVHNVYYKTILPMSLFNNHQRTIQHAKMLKICYALSICIATDSLMESALDKNTPYTFYNPIVLPFVKNDRKTAIELGQLYLSKRYPTILEIWNIADKTYMESNSKPQLLRNRIYSRLNILNTMFSLNMTQEQMMNKEMTSGPITTLSINYENIPKNYIPNLDTPSDVLMRFLELYIEKIFSFIKTDNQYNCLMAQFFVTDRNPTLYDIIGNEDTNDKIGIEILVSNTSNIIPYSFTLPQLTEAQTIDNTKKGLHNMLYRILNMPTNYVIFTGEDDCGPRYKRLLILQDISTMFSPVLREYGLMNTVNHLVNKLRPQTLDMAIGLKNELYKNPNIVEYIGPTVSLPDVARYDTSTDPTKYTKLDTKCSLYGYTLIDSFDEENILTPVASIIKSKGCLHPYESYSMMLNNMKS
jgi:gas vesicle protein